MTGPSLGINLSNVADWTTNSPFLDLFEQSRPWYTQAPGVWDTQQSGLLNLDADGWVKSFTKDGAAAPFTQVSTILNTGSNTLRDGLYVVDWKGSGTLQVGGDVRIVSTSDHRIVLDPGTGAVEIRLLSTDPAHNGDYIRDIRMFSAQDEALLDAGLTFNPDFVDKVDDFRVLRFMDWGQTNNSPITDWAQAPRGTEARFTDAGGVPVDVMVKLANESGADPWFNIPHGASAEYIRNFAQYVHDNLDPGLTARFEYSNEMWNWGFGQTQWAKTEAAKAWGADVGDGFMQWYGMKAAEMARIVAGVYGDELGTRALNVFSTQSAWRGLEQSALNAPEVVAEGGQPPKNAPFQVYAIAPYFGSGIGTQQMSSQVDAWISQGEAGFKAALQWLVSGPAEDSIKNLGPTIAYHAGVAAKLGWKLEGYEGGQHIVDLAGLFGGQQNPARTAFFTALVQRPEMADIYKAYFDTWKAAGGGMMAQYNDISEPGRYGSWGLWSSVYGADTPRSTAVENYLAQVPAWWTDNRPDSTFDGIHTLVDRTALGSLAGGEGRDRLFGLDGDDRLNGNAGHDSLYGNAGNDSLSGGDGNDSLWGGDGHDALSGGAGDDVLVLEAGNDMMDGGDGSDWLQVGGTAGARISLMLTGVQSTGYGDDVLTGIENIRGGAGNDTIDGNIQNNRIEGGGGDDSLRGMNGNDSVSGGDGNDRILCDRGDDVISGGSGDDIIFGASGNDVLRGDAGADRIRGGDGRDIFWGGEDRDRDVFIFGSDGVSKVGAGRDVVEQFVSGIDRIDFHEIDAVLATAATNDAFRWSGTKAAAHSVWWQDSADGVLLRFDNTGDKTPDLEVLLHNIHSIVKADILL